MLRTVNRFRDCYMLNGIKHKLASSHRRLKSKHDSRDFSELTSLAALFFSIALCLFLSANYHAGFHTLNNYTTWLPNHFWANLTYLGDTKIALCSMLFFARKNPAILCIVLIAALYGTILSHGLKIYFNEPRPSAILDPSTFNLVGDAVRKRSFPSGHSLTIFIEISILYYFSRLSSTKITLVLFGFAVALSRVMVSAHWPIDVLVGSGIGILVTLLSIYTAKRWQFGFSPFIHTIVLTLLLLSALSLYYYDGGYPEASLLGKLLATVALGYAVVEYFVLHTPIISGKAKRTHLNRSLIQ